MTSQPTSESQDLIDILGRSFDLCARVDARGVISKAAGRAVDPFSRVMGGLTGSNLCDLVSLQSRTKLEQALKSIDQNHPVHRTGARIQGPAGVMELDLRLIRLDEEAVLVLGGADSRREETAVELDYLRGRIETAEAARTDFLASISHELRTPLNAIIGFTQILGSDPDAPLTGEQREQVDYIAQSSRHLLTLISDILALSKVEGGRAELETSQFSLPELIGECLKSVELRAEARGLTIESTIAPDLDQIQADRRKIKKAIFSLVDNAVKFSTDRGPIRLIASLVEDYAVIEVVDRGVGLSREQLEKVFTPFQRLDPKSKIQGGAGLSLSLSRKLIELHGGRIWADSPGPNQGATFRFRLPISTTVTLEKIMERELEAAKADGRNLSLIMIRATEIKAIKELYTPTDFGLFISEVGRCLRRVIRVQLDRVFVFEDLGLWLVLTPQPTHGADRMGRRVIDLLEDWSFPNNIRPELDLEVIAGPDVCSGQAERKTVLVVDDDKATREVLVSAVATAGYKVKSAVDGATALGVIEGDRIDLMVTDIYMPNMNGEELIWNVRQKGYDFPIIAVTGFSAAAQAANGLPVAGVLSKPFSFSALRRMIDDLLNGSGDQDDD